MDPLQDLIERARKIDDMIVMEKIGKVFMF